MIKQFFIQRKLIKYIDTFKDFSGYMSIKDNKKIIFNKGFGYSNYEEGLKNEIDTKFRIGSLTKQFTAMSIMILQERGYLKVTDKLSDYIPDYPNGEKINLHNLLSMSSGIPTI